MPTIAVSPEGSIEQANRAFARLVGHDKRQVAAMHCSDLMLMIVEDRTAVEILIRHADETVELLHSDLWVVHAALTVRPLRMRLGLGVLASFEDRTAQPWLSAQVVQLKAT